MRLRRFVDTTGDAAKVPAGIATRIDERLNDDLDTPGTLALLWELSKEAQWTPAQIKAAISYADTVLGLGFEHDDAMAKKLYEKDLGVEVAADDAPADIKALLEAREAARAAKDWAKADALRAELAEKGYKIEDGAGGARVVKMG